MTIETLTPEERAALHQEAGERVLQTAARLAELLERRKSGEVSADLQQMARDPGSRLHDENIKRQEAEAALLEELIDLVLPEARLLARPIRPHFTPRTPEENPAPLEALFGALPARHRQAEWLDVPALELGGEREYPGGFTDAQEGDSGASLARLYWVLMDGRLVEVHLVGTWSMRERQLKPTGWTLVSTRVVKALDVVRAVGGLADVIARLRRELHHDYKVLVGKHVRDLPERQARFDALMEDYQNLLVAQTEGLKRVGDKPA